MIGKNLNHRGYRGSPRKFETGEQDLSAASFLRVENALIRAMVAHHAELQEADDILQRVSA